MNVEKQPKESSSVPLPRDGYTQPAYENANSKGFDYKNTSQTSTYFFAKGGFWSRGYLANMEASIFFRKWVKSTTARAPDLTTSPTNQHESFQHAYVLTHMHPENFPGVTHPEFLQENFPGVTHPEFLQAKHA